MTRAGARDLVYDPRHAWKLLLALAPESSVLSIGFERHALSATVEPHVADMHWLSFNDIQTLIDDWIGSSDAEERHSQPFLLPFANASFDLILVQGLPAVRSSRPTGSGKNSSDHPHVHAGQLALLVELHRTLKRHGQLFLAVWNRFSFESPGGQRPAGRGLRKQLAMLQRTWTGSCRDLHIQPLLHTQKGYRRLLKRGGFRINGYLAARYDRDETSVGQLRPIASAGLNWTSTRSRSPMERLRSHPFFASAYWIFAHRGTEATRSVLHSMLEHIASKLGFASSADLALESFELRPKNRVLLRVLAGGRRLFVKVPLDAMSLEGARRNWRMLALMQHRHGVATPAPVSRGNVNGVYYFAEDQIFDKMPATDPMNDDGLSLSQFELLHQAINPDLGTACIVTLTNGLFRALVQRPLDVVLSVVQDSELARCAGQVITDSLHGLPFRRGIVHGDLSFANVCIGQDGRLGLIDWEVSLLRGLPVLDAMDHLLARYRSRHRHSFAEAIRHFCEDTWPDAEESAFLSRAMTRSGVPAERASDVGILYWLRYVAPHVEDGTIFLADGVRRRILNILTRILSFKLEQVATKAQTSALEADPSQRQANLLGSRSESRND